MKRLLNKFSGFIAGMGSTLVLFPAAPAKLPDGNIARHFNRIGGDFRFVMNAEAMDKRPELKPVTNGKDQLWLPGIR